MKKFLLLGIFILNLFASNNFGNFLNNANNNEWYLKSFNENLYLNKYNINSYPRFIIWKLNDVGNLNCFYTNDKNSENKLLKSKYKKCSDNLIQNNAVWIKIY